MSPEYQAAFQNSLRRVYDKHPRYKLGGKIEDGEIDCSELMRVGAKWARIPGISEKRLQAWQLYRGHGGFGNKAVRNWKTGDNERGDLLFQHLKNGLERPDDVNHVLAVVEWHGIWYVIHASYSRHTVVIVPYTEWIEQGVTSVKDGYRRMIIGDK